MKNRVIPIVLVIAICMILSSCTSIIGDSSGFTGKYDLEKIGSDVIDANTAFAFDIFKELNEENGNMFICPLSISTALTMTYNGAVGTTRQAMANTLGFGTTEPSVVNTSFQNLIAHLNNLDKNIELNISNSIWIREGENIRETFLADTGKYFNASAEMLDFTQDSSVQRINRWISDATDGMIDKMLSPPISPDVVMYLINAIYFKGEWQEQFSKDKTFDTKFTLDDGTQQDIQMMSRTGKVAYAKGDNYQVVRLPYQGGKASMYCILPNEETNIDDFIASLDSSKWSEIYSSPVEMDDVILQLPKFRMEYGIKVLNDSLISLGMGEAFGSHADFSGIRKGIAISRVLHKAVIEVNEEGSEASGVTVVEMMESAMVEPLAFIANRPFLFLIVDDDTGTILFMGKMAKAS